MKAGGTLLTSKAPQLQKRVCAVSMAGQEAKTMPPDFSRLYAQLDLTPDCGLEELKRAYRRRIAELHPDRASPADVAGRPMMPLSDLNSIYSQALRFHRAHGRLPGARSMEPTVFASSRAQSERPIATQMPDVPHGADGPSRSRPTAVLVVLGLVLVLTWVAYNGSASTTVGDITDAPVPAEATRMKAPRRQHALEAGMSPDSVRAVLGEPVAIRGDEWDYGPSWIRFEQGKLAQWHSSPLNPLVVRKKGEPDTASTH